MIIQTNKEQTLFIGFIFINRGIFLITGCYQSCKSGGVLLFKAHQEPKKYAGSCGARRSSG